MEVFYATQEHTIPSNGTYVPAWGDTKSWPAIILLTVASVSATLSIGISIWWHPLTGSRSFVVHEIR